MKGQYLAVETVFTFGLGLLVAIGVISLFHQYRIGTLDSAEPEQAELINSKISLAIHSLKQMDEDGEMGSGRQTVELPDNIAGKSYNLRLDENLTIRVGTDSYEAPVSGTQGYSLSGGAQGGDVTVFKDQNEFILRAE